LEHSRVFYFRAGNDEALYLSSADWMNRNMLRRVELAWPVGDVQLRRRIIDECLQTCLNDNVDAWTLNADGQYRQLQPARNRAGAKPKVHLSAQAKLMALYSAKA
jgi:polyphosphate kinase